MINENWLKASKIHIDTQNKIKSQVKEGMKYLDICKIIEKNIKNLSYKNQINNGIAFPTGICVNNTAAHWTPQNDNQDILKKDDVCKIDFGVHYEGCIIDSAFTINLDDKYNNLLKSSREAVDTIISNMGVDVRFNELSLLSKEIVESYEVEINNKSIPIKPIDNLAGHNILPWKIHGGKLLYSVLDKVNDFKIDSGDVIAVEVFTSTGCGTTIMSNNINEYSHFMRTYDRKTIPIFKIQKLEILDKVIKNKFNGLAFCQRYFNCLQSNRETIKDYLDLYKLGLLNIYPPLYEKDKNGIVAQFEETVFIDENSVKILSKEK